MDNQDVIHQLLGAMHCEHRRRMDQPCHHTGGHKPAYQHHRLLLPPERTRTTCQPMWDKSEPLDRWRHEC